MAAWQASTVDVVEMHGSFVRQDAPRPSGAEAPTGSVLTVVVGSKSRQTVAVLLGDSDTVSKGKLGASTTLNTELAREAASD